MMASSDVPPGTIAPPVGSETRSCAISGPENTAQDNKIRAKKAPPFTFSLALEWPLKNDSQFTGSNGHPAAEILLA
jgi:hypothetical protein